LEVYLSSLLSPGWERIKVRGFSNQTKCRTIGHTLTLPSPIEGEGNLDFQSKGI